MRHFLPIATQCLLPVSLMLAAGVAEAAAIKGRVVDSSGKPVAEARVTIWQKLAAPNGTGLADLPVKFNDDDTLVTDADGQFDSPDVLAEESFAQLVVEAEGMLSGQIGWIEIGKEATATCPDIVLRRLRAVIGQVLDRQNRPVVGATVFNAGDGHERVETKTGRGGKFFLDGVSEGAIFLFAEKAGYRFTGMNLSADQTSAAFTLVSLDDGPEPLTTLPPLLTPEEETALARLVLDPWLDEVAKSGTAMQKLSAIASLSHIDPLAALKHFDALTNWKHPSRAMSRHGLVEICIARSAPLSSAEVHELIESGSDQFCVAYECLSAAKHRDAGDRTRQLEWLEAALVHGRRIEDAAQRTQALAALADALFSAAHRERAVAVLAEAEQAAEELPENPSSTYALANALGTLALATVPSNAERALARLEKITSDRDYQEWGGQLAMRLLPERADLAEEVWNRALERRRPAEGSRFPSMPSSKLADFCYRLAAVDLSRAQRIARGAEKSVLRIRGEGAIAMAVAKTNRAEARRLLESLVREELLRSALDGDPWYRTWSPPTTAAWLLPIAELVAPDLCREIFWRSLALRSPRPRRSPFDGEIERTDIELAMMLARYDRNIARALLAPHAARLARMAAVVSTSLPPQLAVVTAASQSIRDVIWAAVYVDPHWAKELLDAVVAATSASKAYATEGARQSFIWALAAHEPARWKESNALFDGF